MRDLIVFVVSIIYAVVLLSIERIAGINLDFHPDATTYLEQYPQYIEQGLQSLPNNAYFFLVSIFSGNAALLITLNILVYSITNILLVRWLQNFLTRIPSVCSWTVVALSALWILAPYRAHLAVHVLKDTIIIFFVVSILLSSNLVRLLLVPLLLVFRIPSIIYGLTLLSKRTLWLFFAFFLAAVSSNKQVLEPLLERQEVDMTGRDYDKVPNFLGLPPLYSLLLRALLWPAMLLSGMFILFSPHPSFFPIVLEILAIQILTKKLVNRYAFNLGLFAALSAIAAIVTAYTPYLRYCYPLLIVAPILCERTITFHNTKKAI